LSCRGNLTLPHCTEPKAEEPTADVTWVNVSLLPKNNIPEARIASCVNAEAPARFIGLVPASLNIPEVLGKLSVPAGVRDVLDVLAASGDALLH
jgi:hypothetical protein